MESGGAVFGAGVHERLIQEIEPFWVPVSEGMWALELRGKNTVLLAHHLNQPDDPPRYSQLRTEKRIANQQNPMLPGFADGSEASGNPLNLIVVHGDKNAEFAFLRVYDNPNAATFIPVSDNIMTSLALPETFVEEEITPPSVSLKPAGDISGAASA